VPFACQVELAPDQRVNVIRVSSHFTSSSATRWTALSVFGARVCNIAYNHVTVNEHKWMISDELEGSQAKPLDIDWRCRKVLHSNVIWTSFFNELILQSTRQVLCGCCIASISCSDWQLFVIWCHQYLKEQKLAQYHSNREAILHVMTHESLVRKHVQRECEVPVSFVAEHKFSVTWLPTNWWQKLHRPLNPYLFHAALRDTVGTLEAEFTQFQIVSSGDIQQLKDKFQKITKENNS